MIYSRFDIIWPGGLGLVEPRSGVDALTYGLSTLVMREELFNTFARDDTYASHGRSGSCEWEDYGTVNHPTQEKPLKTAKLRRGNFFSQFVKKFSLGNGPSDLVNEYLVTKEGGKMLGTLVALSILGMPKLQTFVWDMPTGILRDVWISLSSLGDHQPSNLEKVHIRFHNNKKAMDSGAVRSRSSIHQPSSTATAASPSAGPQTTSSTSTTTDPLAPKLVISNHHVESPNFSILPPLTSIIAIAMDELANLNELSVLVGKSADKVRDLRVGIAPELHSSGFLEDSRAMRCLQAPNGQSTLRLLFSELDLDEVAGLAANDSTTCLSNGTSTEKDAQDPALSAAASTLTKTTPDVGSAGLDIASIDPALTPCKTNGRETNLPNMVDESLTSSTDTEVLGDREPKSSAFALTSDPALKATSIQHNHETSPAWQRKSKQSLKLEILQLERHILDPRLLKKAIDWSTLTSLTLLRCGGTDRLWRAFREWFAPSTRSQSLVLAIPTKSLDKKTGVLPKLRRMPTLSSPADQTTKTYRLNLKSLHTDTVSTDLMVFLKDTLAPNSLQYLFLQDTPEYSSPVTIAQIHKGALRRHHGSLTKILLDSSHGPKTGGRSHALSAKKWTLNRDLLAYITSPGKFPKIRELCVSLEYKDWHYFLQQLPHIPTLRSLHIPVIGEHVYGRDFSIRDVAMGVTNVINLRQECELAYLAIANKCFEIVETPVRKKGRRGRSKGSEQNAGGAGNGNDDDSSSDDAVTPHPSDEDDDDDDDDSDEEGGGGQGNVAAAAAAAQATNAMESSEVDELLDNGSPSSEDEEAAERPAKLVKMKMREILFYDDGVSIFKARH
ncbi:MAG: hypothetical protein OHK93_000955, partial [Ramalina farinacea]|nr:hypothetical protein [Ramalina farinacea]